MADEPKPRRGERFTIVEMGGPLNPSPEELASRVVDIAFKERFTMLEPSGPLNPSPEELATRVIEPLINDGPVDVKLLGPMRRLGNMLPPGHTVRKAGARQLKNNPSPEELATPAVNPLINGDPTESEPPAPVPAAVRSLLAQLATAIAALDANGRAATLDYISNEFTKRLAG